MLPPLPEPIVQHLGSGERWIVKFPCEIPLGDGVKMTVPEGFTYDLASTDLLSYVPIPGLADLFESCRLSTLAALGHDAFYAHNGAPPPEWFWPYATTMSRREADDLFYTLMRRQRVGKVRARLAWLGVRLFARRW